MADGGAAWSRHGPNIALDGDILHEYFNINAGIQLEREGWVSDDISRHLYPMISTL
jgi:hypothetical protein